MKLPNSLSWRRRAVLAVAAFCAVGATAVKFHAADAGLPYRKASTWQETMFSTREAMYDAKDPVAGVFCGLWETSGPFEGAKAELVPEQNPAAAKWSAHRDWYDGETRRLKMTPNAPLYMRRKIVSAADRTINAGIGMQGVQTAWLNGEKIFQRNSAPDRNSLKLALRKGDNTLMVKYLVRNDRVDHYFTLGRPREIEVRRREAVDKLWERLEADFPNAAIEMAREAKDGIWAEDWLPGDVGEIASRYALATRGKSSGEARLRAAKVKAIGDLAGVRALYNRARNLEEIREMLATVKPEAVRLAVDDMRKQFGSRYAKGADYEKQLAALEKPFAEAQANQSDDAALERLGDAVRRYQAVSREALLANPMLDANKMLVIRRNFGVRARHVMSKALGMPVGNSWTNEDVAHTGWDNQIATMTNLRGKPRLERFYEPDGGKIVLDVELDFDAKKVMFSSIGSSDRYRVFEMNANGTGVKQLSPDVADVDYFDSCYLPNGKIAFTSTAGYQAMPCIGGGAPMAQLFTSDGDGKNIRQITFEQDSDWTPAVLNDGRLMYLRWEYADLPHYFTRILFASNPDGTGAREYFHSNSYFPNSFFYARAIPGHPTQVVGIATGHHGISRSGRMLIVDPEQGRAEADGVVQEIPGRGKKVEALIRDPLVDGVWPQFLQPYPLADYANPARPAGGGKYFLAAMKRDANSLWGIYLVDAFDNLTLIKEVEGAALLEPVMMQATPRPPVIPDRIKPADKNATIYLSDVYSGPGLQGIPRGKVKSLRLFAYHFNYNKTGGHDSVGIQSGWDIKRILGTVPVEEDGSASFVVPANTPITVQPLDENGQSLQLMRSWFAAMPGEVLSCVGCHDRLNAAPPSRANMASRRAPSNIKPWYGPARPFAYRTEVQPVLDRYCVGCHNGANNHTTLNLAFDPNAKYFTEDRSYIGLQQFIHRYGPEADAALQKPMEFHTSTSPLFQMLAKGHHGVKLDAESMDRLITWSDLNVPWRGSWGVNGNPGQVPRFRDQEQVQRRRELAILYANLDTDPEREYADTLVRVSERGKPSAPPRDAVVKHQPIVLKGWPFDGNEAKRMQQAAGNETSRSFDLGNGVKLEMTLIPAGSYVMGDVNGAPDEAPQSVARIDKPFWMGRFEITNQQYARFDARHDSRFFDQQGKDHFVPGYPANTPEQPVIRVSWQQAMAFCKWLSEKTGQRFTLPTEAQWEWAARAGTGTPLWFGGIDANFSAFANLADGRIKGYMSRYQGKMFSHIPFIESVDDGAMVSGPVGKYRGNAWGLVDMHGNVAEWTLSSYKAYPYNPRDGRDNGAADAVKVVRGGSWRDRPQTARSGFRLAYQPYQAVWDVGFRVVMEADSSRAAR